MAGTTYSKFFWADWSSDPKLLLCSLAAQGLWMRLLCLAAESDRPGHVLIAGRKPTVRELHDVTRAPIADLEKLMAELKKNGVCDTDRDGVMISRRMVRDFRRRVISSAGGKSRQRQIAENVENSTVGSSLSAQPICTATIYHKPESTNHQPEQPAAASRSVDENWGAIARLSEAIGFNLTRQTGGFRFVDQLVRLEAEGFDLELDMIPACNEARATGKIPPDLTSLEWFRRRFESKRAQRKVSAIAAVPNASPSLTFDEWAQALRTFLVVGIWVRSDWGPAPTEPGCKAPADMIAKAKTAWDQAGQHPRSAFEGNHLVAWSPDLSETFKVPTPFAGIAA